MKPMTPATPSEGFERSMRILSSVVPAIAAASGIESAATAAHDEGVIRTVGLGFTGVFRALDVILAAPFVLLPIGTRALRAGLASALVTGVCGAVLFDLALALVTLAIPAALARVLPGSKNAKPPSPKLLAAVAAVAVLSALLAPAWQTEASAPGGSVTGALLVLLALRVAHPTPGESVDRLPAIALLVGLAASYEPMTGLAALVGAVAFLARKKDEDLRPSLKMAFAFVLGLTPLALGLLLSRRPAEVALTVPLFTAVERGAAYSLPGLVSAELGVVLGLAIAAGAGLSLVAEGARRHTIALLALVGTAILALGLHMNASPSHVAAPILVGLATAHVLAAVALGATVIAISRARVPFAEASAALVVVLELVLPVRALDDTATRREARAPHATPIWNDVAWESAPPAALLLVSDRATMRRITAARATGQMRPDLLIVPAFDLHGRLATRALVIEPKLAPLYRDVALGLPPEELSFGEIATQRAVLATFDPKWDRALARHLVPVGLTSRFEPEPRGASDRKKALEAFTPAKDRLVRVTVARKDPELAAATATLLRARAIAMAAAGEKEMLARALDDLRAFAPDDPVGTTLVRRTVTTKGPIDVRDLAL